MEERDVIKTMQKKKRYIGANATLKQIKNNKIKTVIISSNCPQETRNKLEGSKTEVHVFDGNSKELGILCGKPFNISTLGLE